MKDQHEEENLFNSRLIDARVDASATGKEFQARKVLGKKLNLTTLKKKILTGIYPNFCLGRVIWPGSGGAWSEELIWSNIHKIADNFEEVLELELCPPRFQSLSFQLQELGVLRCWCSGTRCSTPCSSSFSGRPHFFCSSRVCVSMTVFEAVMEPSVVEAKAGR